ncbi:pyridoxamine 5'-phosphate oxidase family protein [Saccharomonospora amisosensis]|nr:pyridoxamine 5'-phosphate oxidase family protein [Saccharomonospora amisosensis]
MTPTIEIQNLAEAECLGLMRSQPVGRLVFTENALPAIRPVNYVLDGRDIIVKASPETWISRLAGSVVAFEVDQIDPRSHTGWSVVVLGKAEFVTDIDQLVRLSDPNHRPWAPGRHDRCMRLRAAEITGRRLALAA